MNYPVWEVSFGTGLLMAIVSVVHVFISHFAVGGGLFLVLTEHKAYRQNDEQLLDWLKKHSKFFVLVTVVFGVVTGVGIWFTIGLIQPTGTSNLIHAFVWAWAIEWIFFFLEITAALLYLYGWQKVDRKLHLTYGWIYFIAAFMSMVVINGMITFMLTPGQWLQSHAFLDGFFNPTYWPSLFTRFLFSLALAGIYALLTASVLRQADLKGKIVKWSLSWIIPAFVLVGLAAVWYKGAIPAEFWQNAEGLIETATFYFKLMGLFALITFLLALLSLIKPSRMSLILALIITGTAFVTMWSFEFVRESIRKPYVITGYLYGNSLFAEAMPGDQGLTVEKFQENGLLQSAKWASHKEITNENMDQAGREIFRLQCMSCHTLNAYRSVTGYIKKYQWDEATLAEMLKGLELMRNGVMPPFAGTDQERMALAHYLSQQVSGVSLQNLQSGELLFKNICGRCHQPTAEEAAVAFFEDTDQETAYEVLDNLPDMMEQMPMLHLTPQQKDALIEYLKSR